MKLFVFFILLLFGLIVIVAGWREIVRPMPEREDDHDTCLSTLSEDDD